MTEKRAMRLNEEQLDKVSGGTEEYDTSKYPVSENGQCPNCGGYELDRWGYAEYPYSLYLCSCGTLFKRVDNPAVHPLLPKQS